MHRKHTILLLPSERGKSSRGSWASRADAGTRKPGKVACYATFILYPTFWVYTLFSCITVMINLENLTSYSRWMKKKHWFHVFCMSKQLPSCSLDNFFSCTYFIIGGDFMIYFFRAGFRKWWEDEEAPPTLTSLNTPIPECFQTRIRFMSFKVTI